ncbi:MAG: hypothetical protein RLZZ97_22, partial [Gemmatimonadota bacterium]
MIIISLLSPMLLAATLAAQGVAQPDTAALRGARQPATAVNGAVAFAHDGQLYLQRNIGAAAVRITNGSAWHRDPTFTTDGSAIVFASDSMGNYDLWQMPVNTTG